MSREARDVQVKAATGNGERAGRRTRRFGRAVQRLLVTAMSCERSETSGLASAQNDIHQMALASCQHSSRSSPPLVAGTSSKSVAAFLFHALCLTNFERFQGVLSADPSARGDLRRLF
jgi:hypothetical protein